MYALCVSGAVNTQGFVWKSFMRHTYINLPTFIHSLEIIRIKWRVSNLPLLTASIEREAPVLQPLR